MHSEWTIMVTIPMEMHRRSIGPSYSGYSLRGFLDNLMLARMGIVRTISTLSGSEFNPGSGTESNSAGA